VTYTRCCIDTIDSPDDEHGVARNMYKTEIYTQKRIVRQVGHLPRIIPRNTTVFVTAKTHTYDTWIINHY